MIGGRVVGAVRAAYPERDGALNLVRQALELWSGEVVGPAVGADRGVAAGDVEAHAHHAHLIAVRRHAADRHDVTQMTVGHERHALGPRRHVAQLGERLFFVGAENGRLVHAVSEVSRSRRAI